MGIMEVPVAAELWRTKCGLFRPESGVVRYSIQHWMKFRADAEELLYIMRTKMPANTKEWSLHLLNKAYCSGCRRHGSWDRLNLCLHDFVSLFPRTFELFGPHSQLVRPLRSSVSSVADGEEEVMKRLALAKQRGVVHAQTPIEGAAGGASTRLIQATPDIQHSCAKACYVPSRSESRRSSARTSYASRPTTAGTSRPSRPTSRPTSASRWRPSRPTSASVSRPTSASYASYASRPTSASIPAHARPEPREGQWNFRDGKPQ
ncbi:unnamed protein product [Effrenium voratum]|nr:unnamed protein product [Effrenium voratum]